MTSVYEDRKNYENYEIEIEIRVPAEIVIEATDTLYTIGKDTKATVKCTGALSEFKKAAVDGETVSSENYTLTEGSTILTIKQVFMDQLSLGEHKITLTYPSGDAETTILVKEKEPETEETETDQTEETETEQQTEETKKTESSSGNGNSGSKTDGTGTNTGSSNNSTGTGAQAARTGDDTPIGRYLMLMLLAAAGLTGCGVFRRRRKIS